MASPASGFNVEGTVKRYNGMAVMTLGPKNEPTIKVTMLRPSTQEVLDKTEAGTLVAHATQQPAATSFVTRRVWRMEWRGTEAPWDPPRQPKKDCQAVGHGD